MPKPYPTGFRDDVVRVARNREPGVTTEKIARDFGVHPMTLQKWMRRADIDEGSKGGKPQKIGASLCSAFVSTGTRTRVVDIPDTPIAATESLFLTLPFRLRARSAVMSMAGQLSPLRHEGAAAQTALTTDGPTVIQLFAWFASCPRHRD